MNEHTTSGVLNRAADHIQKYGLHKGSGHGGGNIRVAPACTIGALNLGARGEDLKKEPDVFQAALAAFRAYIPTGTSIPAWSDAPERTADEVVEALRAAALIEAAREEQDAAWSTYAGCVTS